MYRLLLPHEFTTSPWKNGGGITHEIARWPEEGPWHWRLSIAEVASDGPFSRFDGMERILTVIEGAGIDLHSPAGVMQARLGQPVAFSGEVPIDSQMVDGPIRDFNVIFDPRHCAATVALAEGPVELALGPQVTAVYGLTGQALPPGAVLLADTGTLPLPKGAQVLVVRLAPA